MIRQLSANIIWFNPPMGSLRLPIWVNMFTFVTSFTYKEKKLLQK